MLKLYHTNINDDMIKTHLDQYNCIRLSPGGRKQPVLLPHKAILKEELFVLDRYDCENPPRYRIVTIDEKAPTPYLVLNETQECELIGCFESIESAHIFGKSRSVERYNELFLSGIVC